MGMRTYVHFKDLGVQERLYSICCHRIPQFYALIPNAMTRQSHEQNRQNAGHINPQSRMMETHVGTNYMVAHQLSTPVEGVDGDDDIQCNGQIEYHLKLCEFFKLIIILFIYVFTKCSVYLSNPCTLIFHHTEGHRLPKTFVHC